ncbi:MAG: anion permease [Candidatus Aquicultor secundus]|uniref:Anion permease n=1 Tax=Candidatus Aquicultor secundus TaxID=1973895 RepID=A0A2M7T842_9ACTN|nr:inorganic phosphate transporter [Candidatus Aquicultor secundus]NCO66393.1 inorganic phosphate transporter [Solirubrobacter sp.]OIO84308.1 MAG: anion permease [Candidatus Aquicultor secundus]PIU27022.1 MAG: anion permease [Candidatus Aquicultor secundus]PIW21517.1 MAG: anion permease [Candidatus Aquicultor secundus]PIX52295.1 MAG: anion permease [Candidatus Aquicultor secundus]
MPSLLIVVLIIAVALVFDFINGFHDAANSIATVVATRVLTPRLAVIWAAFFNFVAVFVFGLHVATTVGKGIVMPTVIDNTIIASALIGAVVWGIITWWKGIPSSSSHALIGGLIGAALVKAGPSALVFSGINKTLLFIVISPLIGFILAVLFTNILFSALRNVNTERANRFFRKAQLFSAAAYSLGHGGNDAQKTIGIISALLFSAGYLKGSFYIPLWVILISYSAMAIGTLLGGFKIVKTMGSKLTKLKPADGFIAETAGAATLFFASSLGVPVSTTHTISGSIVGVGSTKRFKAVRWPLASRIVWAWIFTIPASAIIAALTVHVIQVF